MGRHPGEKPILYTAYISAGSNIGDKRRNCQKGIAALLSSGETELKKQSLFYRTEPVDLRQQDWYANCVVKVTTASDPFELLHSLKRIETDAGRLKDSVRFGPRILDLDIILYDNCVIRLPELIIPHPRMHKRRFVLKPICDIEPDIVHPVLKKTMQELLHRLDLDGQSVEPYPCDS